MLKVNNANENQIHIPQSNQQLISSFFRKFEGRKQSNPLTRHYSRHSHVQMNESARTDLVYQKRPYLDQTKIVEPENKNIKARRSVSAMRSTSETSTSTTNIYALTYVDKELTTVPNEVLENKHQLNILDFNLNKFNSFPSELFLLQNLKVLRFDRNQLKSLPEGICNFQQLEVLSISHNLLQTLPRSLNRLINLCDLNVESNLLHSFGSEISELKSLKVLNINKNRFTLFPTAFCEMSNVVDLCFEWFKYTNPPLPPRQRGPEGEQKIHKLRDICKEVRQKNQPGLDFLLFLDVISTSSVDLTAVDRTQKSYLHYAAIYEDISVMKYLVSNVPSLLDLIDSEGQSALTASIIREKYFAARYLIKHGADVGKGGGKFGSALHIAVRKLNLQLVKDLIKAGDLVNKLDNDGHTPLHHATILMADGNLKAATICHYLLEQGANPSIRNKDNWTPLHLTTRRKDRKTLEWMLWYNREVDEVHGGGQKFNINQKGGTYQWTAMHIAVYSNAPQIIETLALANCEIFKRSLSGYTPKRLVHHHGLNLKMIEKYEKSYLHRRILFPQNVDLDRSINVNLQNLRQSGEIYRASKNRFDTDMFDEDASPLPVYTTEKTYAFDNNLKTKPGYESYLPNYRLESKEYTDSFEVAPETDTHYSLPDDTWNEVETSRHNFTSELNENVTVKANTFTKELNFSRNINKLKEGEYAQGPSKNKLRKFVMFLDLDACSYENYLTNEPNFGVDFCKRELEMIKECFLAERVVFIERAKIFILLRVLHQRILKYISTELNITLNVAQYSLLSLQDPLLLAAKKGTDFYAKQKELQMAIILTDLIPQTLISFYGLIPSVGYEKVMLKSIIISMIEELMYFKAFRLFESVMKDVSENSTTKLNARRALCNLRTLRETITLEPTVHKIQENQNIVRRARASTPATRPESIVTEHSHIHRQRSNERPISSCIRPSTKITLTPFKLLK